MQSMMECSHSVKEFPNREKSEDKQITDSQLFELEKLLRSVTYDLQSNLSNDTRQLATHKVTDAMNLSSKTMAKYGHHDIALLLNLIMKTVGYREDSLSFILGVEEIKFIHETLSKVHNKYILKNCSSLEIDAYVLLTILTVSNNKQSINKQETLQMYCNVKVNMPPEISDAIKQWQTNKEWDLLVTKIVSLTEVQKKEDEKPPKTEEQTPIAKANSFEEDENKEQCGNISSKLLFQKLGLFEKDLCQITVSDLLCINNWSLKDAQPGTDSELWSYFINKLMMSDVNSRYVCSARVKKECAITSVNEDDFFNFGSEGNESDDVVDSHIHPMDVYLAVFHCADDFAQQRILMKLSMCQFGLPLLVPNPFTGQIEVPAYALQNIKKSWVSVNLPDPKRSIRHLIFDAHLPVVSFIRLGTSVNSKSQIMNNILNHNKHPTFFNRHCSNSTKNSLLLEGVVEVAWYCPGGTKNDIFQNCVTFINLHGDAKNHPKQLKFLQELSSVMVLLLPENPQDPEKQTTITLQRSQFPLIVLFSGAEHRHQFSDFRIAAKNRNEAELTEEITDKIKQALTKRSELHSLKAQIDKARMEKLIGNKEKEVVWYAFQKVKTLVEILKGTKSKLLNNQEHLTLKNQFLPLQDSLWSDWCKYDKEFYRIKTKTGMTIDQQITEILGKKHEVRKKQKEIACNLNEFMTQFLQCVLQMERNEKIAVLSWLEKGLGDLFTDALAELLNENNVVCTHTRQNDTQSSREDTSDQIKSDSFGLQHIMREVAQIYEILHHFGETMCTNVIHVDQLPELGAEILLSGYALELMDGDVNHIPLEWIKAVINKLINKVGDKRIFVISVLGLQSSGKSTLLNTMFGLQFPVSAGCCTKGILMHLVPVEETQRECLQFDFVLVLDSEGLQSTKMNKELNHDNELATFIVGIGDITIINIMGENTSEMDDILQICFQAFLRMTSVQVKPCCFFVHQNVSDEAAKEKTQEGRIQLKLKLDQIAKVVGEAEEREVNSFADVIQLDFQTQVYYFKNYFSGDPPMASPSPSYCQNVWELKKKLLLIADWQKNYCFLPLSEFSKQVQNLWSALMKENFVFHFRNSLHVMVFNKLEEQYGKWSWNLRKQALETHNTLYCMINRSDSYDTQIEVLKKDIECVYNKIKSDVDSYFKNEKHSEILVQWRDQTDKRIECLKNEVIDELYAKERDLLNNKNYCMKLDQRRTEYEADLLQKSKELASKLKEQTPNDEKLQESFDCMWKEWETKVKSEKPKEKPINIQAAVENKLLNYYSKYESRINIKDEICFDVKSHVKYSVTQTITTFWNKYTDKAKEVGPALQTNLQYGVDKLLAEKENQENCDVMTTFIHQILTEINNIIEENERSSGISFKGLYKAQVAASVLNKTVPKLTLLHEKALKASDPLVYFNCKRPEYCTLFKKCCKGATAVTIFCDYLMTYLKSPLENATNNKLSIEIVDQIKLTQPAFSSRANLEKHILKDLAVKEDFDSYMEYISTPKKYFETFISDSVSDYLNGRVNIDRIINESWTWFRYHIQTASISATEYMMEQKSPDEKPGNTANWLDKFCEQVERHMCIPRKDLTNLETEDIQDSEFLKKYFEESLEELIATEKKKQIDYFRSGLVLFKLKIRPDDILSDEMKGCWEQCPFCKAVCINPSPNHDSDHMTQMHRCQALGRLFCSTWKFHWSFYPWEWFQKEKKYFLSFCTSAVGDTTEFSPPHDLKKSIKFNEYKKAGHPYDKWTITQDSSKGLYWKWFMYTFFEKLENHYGFKFEEMGGLPEEWKKITKREALMELNIPD